MTGAIFGGLVALTVQARLFRREDRYRFNDLKRKKYVSLLVDAQAWLEEVSKAHSKFVTARSRKADNDPLLKRPPPVDVSDPAPLTRLAREVSLLGDDAVTAAATNLAEQIDDVDHIRARLIRVGVYAVTTPALEEAAGRSYNDDPDARTLNRSHDVIDEFFAAARVDLGVARPTWTRRLVRWLRSALMIDEAT